MARQRSQRSLRAKLGSVVLGTESLVVFLAGLAVYGLGALPEWLPSWWGIVFGAVLAVLMLITAGIVHTRAGVIVGWALQVMLALGGFLVPGILFVALIFGGMWAFAMIKSEHMERRPQAPEGEADAG